jgi:L-methionine (R)-S-oxide reductase
MMQDAYRGALEAIDRIVNREREADEVLRKVVAALHDRFEHYSWVGIYLVEADDLVLGPWKGPAATEHVRIPIGQGICGAAAASARTEIVDDVNADERYLACFPSTRSEIVVPIAFEGQVVGEIDIDSDVPAAFGPADRTFLERVAVLVSPHCLVAWDAPSAWAERVGGDAETTSSERGDGPTVAGPARRAGRREPSPAR